MVFFTMQSHFKVKTLSTYGRISKMRSHRLYSETLLNIFETLNLYELAAKSRMTGIQVLSFRIRRRVFLTCIL